jgi:hypothetical protein
MKGKIAQNKNLVFMHILQAAAMAKRIRRWRWERKIGGLNPGGGV